VQKASRGGGGGEGDRDGKGKGKGKGWERDINTDEDIHRVLIVILFTFS